MKLEEVNNFWDVICFFWAGIFIVTYELIR